MRFSLKMFSSLGLVTAIGLSPVVKARATNVSGAAASDLLFDFQPFTVQHRLDEFSWVVNTIEENYAPLEYKQERFGFTWEELKDEYRQRIKKDMNREEFAHICQAFVGNLRDAHTSARPMRDLVAGGFDVKLWTLGFTTKRHIDHGETTVVVDHPWGTFFGEKAPVQTYDIIESIDGRKTQDIIKDDILPYTSTGQPDSDLTLATWSLTTKTNLDGGVPLRCTA